MAVSAGSVIAAAAALALGEGPATTVQASTPAAATTATGAGGTEGTNAVRLNYGNPRRSGRSDEVTWTWTVTNRGAESARRVVVTHDVGDTDVGKVPGICETRRGTVVCRIGNLDPGESVANRIELDLPEDGGRVFLRGHVNWGDGSTTVTRSASIRPTAPKPRSTPHVQQKPKGRSEPAPMPIPKPIPKPVPEQQSTGRGQQFQSRPSQVPGGRPQGRVQQSQGPAQTTQSRTGSQQQTPPQAQPRTPQVQPQAQPQQSQPQQSQPQARPPAQQSQAQPQGQSQPGTPQPAATVPAQPAVQQLTQPAAQPSSPV